MRILILGNSDGGLYSFRRELLETLSREHEVHFSTPYGPYVEKFEQMGCIYHTCEFDLHGTNPVKGLGQILTYRRLLKQCRPDVVLTYTIKPNVYGGIACSLMGIPYIANITGVHGAVLNGGLIGFITTTLYRIGLRKAQQVFFQNQMNLDFMLGKHIVSQNYSLIPGSGVNLNMHCFEPYPSQEEPLIFLTIGRIMESKGTREILSAAKEIKKEYPKVVFRFIGAYEEEGDYRTRMDEAVAAGIVEYLGPQSNIHPFVAESHATIHASSLEGMSNVLLETAATGRPVIATDIPGCRETYDDGVSGISCKAKDPESLAGAIRKFIALPYAEKAAMGAAGRKKMEQEFDRNIVVTAYLEEIEKAARKRESREHRQ